MKRNKFLLKLTNNQLSLFIDDSKLINVKNRLKFNYMDCSFNGVFNSKTLQWHFIAEAKDIDAKLKLIEFINSN